MTSTRNNNTQGDYSLQQKQYSLVRDWQSYKYSSRGCVDNPVIPCIGLMPSHLPHDTLSNNPIDIESSLFGINSNNLVAPQDPIEPQLKTIPMQSWFERIPLFMPVPMVVQNKQRPFPIPN